MILNRLNLLKCICSRFVRGGHHTLFAQKPLTHILAIFIFLILVTSFFVPPAMGQTDLEYIDITNPFFKKIPIAVPYFNPVSGLFDEKIVSKRASDLLAETLEFTGYMKALDRGAFLINSPSDTLSRNINFPNWISIGAELLITGGVQIQNDLLKMELRLYDTVNGRMLVGKRYKGRKKDERKIVRRFCGEVLYSITGSRGFFDTKIAFVSTGSGNKEIYMCEFDGYDPKQFTHKKKITLFPAWSSNGNWMAYTSFAKGKPDLYIEHIREKRGYYVAREGTNSTPAWIPGKFELAASLSFSGDQEIYLLTGRGKIIKRLTRTRGIDLSPSWSPDGKKMAFVSKRSGTPQIHIMDIDSGQVRRLTFEGRYNTQPSWSPKGDKIAYSAMEDGWTNILVIGIDGQGLIRLTHGQRDNESPSWAPDGGLIVFSTTREGPSKIYVMTAYGTDQRRLLSLPGEQTNPKWSPRGINN